MDPINVYQAKTKLSEMIDRAAAGEEIVISRHGRPVARLVAYGAPAGKRRKLGVLAGKGWMADDFDGPLPEDVLADFEGRD
jgi:prevent-host-death family protein